MNTELLKQTAALILAHPEQFHMRSWDCGTTACIAGHACRIAGDPIPPDTIPGYEHAKRILCIPDDDAFESLAYVSNWPTHFQEDYAAFEMEDDEEGMARVAHDRILAFLKDS